MEAGVMYVNSLSSCTTTISSSSTKVRINAIKNNVLLISKNNFKYLLDKKVNINKVKDKKMYLNKNPFKADIIKIK